MKKHVVIIYPHPDDESFGAAGTIAQFRKQGTPVTYLCGTLGEMGRNMGSPLAANRETLPEIRKQELLNACEILDMDVELLGYRDKTLEFENKATIAIHLKEYLDRLKPDLVITHYPGYAVHPDHDALGAAAIEAVRMIDKKERPVLWAQAISNDFQEKLGEPTVINNISQHIDTKMKAIFSHTTQAQGILSQFSGQDFIDDEIKKEIAERFSVEQFYVWRFND